MMRIIWLVLTLLFWMAAPLSAQSDEAQRSASGYAPPESVVILTGTGRPRTRTMQIDPDGTIKIWQGRRLETTRFETYLRPEKSAAGPRWKFRDVRRIPLPTQLSPVLTKKLFSDVKSAMPLGELDVGRSFHPPSVTGTYFSYCGQTTKGIFGEVPSEPRVNALQKDLCDIEAFLWPRPPAKVGSPGPYSNGKR